MSGLLVAVGALAQGRDGVVVVDPRACQLLERHVPDVDVAYRPGVDVRGRPVAPADLPGSWSAGAVDVPITFDITLDIAERLGVPLGGVARRYGLPNAQGLRLDNIVAAQVEVAGDRVILNGTEVGGAARDELYLLCRQHRR